MMHDPLLITLLDLDAALSPASPLIVGGGYGLFLKQLHLAGHPEIRTLFPKETWPVARTTQDIDLILRADIVTDSNSMKTLRVALDTLGFEVVERAKYTQFARPMSPGTVKLDLLAAPLGGLSNRVPKDKRRVKPQPSIGLHASKLEEALAVDRNGLLIPISGTLSSGLEHRTAVLVPQSFSYLLMKLCAFRDRMQDVDKSLGQHHALDIYRIVAMLTREEDEGVRRLSDEFAGHPLVLELREFVLEHFAAAAGLGRLRIREHPLGSAASDLDRFAEELLLLLGRAG